MNGAKKIWGLIKETFKEWSADGASRLGAALSYYTIFAIAPLLVLIISVAGLLLGDAEEARRSLVAQLQGLLGPDAAQVIQTALQSAMEKKTGGVFATVIGLVTLFVGATGVMIELQNALNVVWKVMPKPGAGIRGLIRNRVLSLGLILSFGFLLLVSLAMSTMLSAVGGWLGRIMPGWVIVGWVLNAVVSLGVIALLFALLFKLLPDAKVAWRDVWVGAIVTSVLFQLGKFGIALYIGKASVASAFGAAGSLAILLVWIYYSSQLVLLGAEFTRAYANRYGSHVVPTKNAVPAPSAEVDRQAAERAQKLGAPSPRPQGA